MKKVTDHLHAKGLVRMNWKVKQTEEGEGCSYMLFGDEANRIMENYEDLFDQIFDEKMRDMWIKYSKLRTYIFMDQEVMTKVIIAEKDEKDKTFL